MDELLNRISSRELTEWMLYAKLEPFGAPIEDLFHARTVAAIYNVNRDADKHKEPFAPNEFMLKANQPKKKKPDPVDLFAKLKGWFGLGKAN